MHARQSQYQGYRGNHRHPLRNEKGFSLQKTASVSGQKANLRQGQEQGGTGKDRGKMALQYGYGNQNNSGIDR
jgi:hypothetical protein